jgi:hypothetical protein
MYTYALVVYESWTPVLQTQRTGGKSLYPHALKADATA